MAGPVGDLSRRQPARCAIDEKQLDLLAAHASTNFPYGDSSGALVSRPENALARSERRRLSSRALQLSISVRSRFVDIATAAKAFRASDCIASTTFGSST